MIVRDLGDAWQVVMQTDHADLSAAFARAWATPLPPVARRSRPSATTTAGRCGSSRPRVDDAGKPVNFLEVDVRAHLAFYRAGIAAITEEDEDAGLLVSMHGAGIYKQRYGLDTALGLTRAAEVQDEVDAFVAEQEAKFGGEPGDRLEDYTLLQLFDRLSLYFCMRDAGVEEAELQGSDRAGRAVARAPVALPVRRTAPAGRRCFAA